MKGWIWFLVKLAVAAALVAYVVGQIETRDRLLVLPAASDGVEHLLDGDLAGDWRSDAWTFQVAGEAEPRRGGDPLLRPQPGFFTALRGLSWSWFALGVAAWGALLLLSGWRWHRLLLAADVRVPLREAVRLSFIGNFFNNVMFGATGGDLVRAVMVTRGLTENRWRAALSVLVDRLIGLFVLLVIGAAVLTVAGRQGDFARVPALHKVWLAVLAILALALLGAGVYFSRHARALLRLDAILARLPARDTIAKMDGALTLYRTRWRTVAGAFVVSVPLQACGILSFYAFARALGAQLAADDAAVVFPVVQTVSAVPIAPAGWGLGESLYGFFFARYGAGFTLGVATSVLFRLSTQVGWGLVGGGLWAFTRARQDAGGAAPSAQA